MVKKIQMKCNSEAAAELIGKQMMEMPALGNPYEDEFFIGDFGEFIADPEAPELIEVRGTVITIHAEFATILSAMNIIYDLKVFFNKAVPEKIEIVQICGCTEDLFFAWPLPQKLTAVVTEMLQSQDETAATMDEYLHQHIWGFRFTDGRDLHDLIEKINDGKIAPDRSLFSVDEQLCVQFSRNF